MESIMLYSLSLLFCATLITMEDHRLLQHLRGIWKECPRFREDTSLGDQCDQALGQ